MARDDRSRVSNIPPRAPRTIAGATTPLRDGHRVTGEEPEQPSPPGETPSAAEVPKKAGGIYAFVVTSLVFASGHYIYGKMLRSRHAKLVAIIEATPPELAVALDNPSDDLDPRSIPVSVLVEHLNAVCMACYSAPEAIMKCIAWHAGDGERGYARLKKAAVDIRTIGTREDDATVLLDVTKVFFALVKEQTQVTSPSESLE
ncbi:unnamed protein product [Mycena citricolor]|uniref:Uncharacterized protein n=1 Tax=Mycena citricolor TaxID=2018698 RepID=A0AAD2K3X0_9AGAR|nr:unnamed protein product [Mycena citricolor]